MAKTDDLEKMKRMALKEITEWLDLQGRVEDEFNSWAKDDFVEYLARKLSVDDINALAETYDEDGPPYFRQRVLVELFGLPPKDVMLERATKEELVEAMEILEEQGACQIYFRSLPAYELREYLKNKLPARELADLLGWLDDEDSEDEDSEDEDSEDEDDEDSEDEDDDSEDEDDEDSEDEDSEDEDDDSEDEDDDSEDEPPPSSSAKHEREIKALFRRIAARGRK